MKDKYDKIAEQELPIGDAATAATVWRGIEQMREIKGRSFTPDLSSYPANIARWVGSKIRDAEPVGGSTFPPARLLTDQNATVVSAGKYDTHANEFANEAVLAIGPVVKSKYA